MKKLIAVLLMITLLASLSVCAFAADSSSSETDKTKVESPVQEGSKSSGGGDEPAVGGAAAPAKDEEPTQEVSITAPIAAEDVAATDEEGNEVAAKVSEDAEGADEAKDALTAENIMGALSGDAADKAEGKNLTASEPVIVESEDAVYPMRVTLPIADLDTFVAALIFENGAWTAPEQEVDEDASTVSFTINRPVFITVVYTDGDVAA
ncbi:MAG: hypothetical protein J5949_01855 [Oscillospiraceae bacterium]|nr:hypothetical protein [Oscillospiraceae bacterium]